ncbi:hypothetical protein C7C56_026105 [Massilia glaciei]|uniref:Uncharacterized protein n=1 Tax=Massilia glaciei TaxID=1524097 RepID=A0A2U2HC44_9BURK|nr:hypothetical protein C7C56_026105 [Massilia glaciei]
MWRDKYCVVLCPDRLEAIRRRGRACSAVELKFAQALVPSMDGPPWRAAVEGLRRFLEMPEIGKGELGIVLSNHFVRYLLIPWNDQIASEEEFRNYAAAAFEEVYGEAGAGWEVSVSAERPGSPRLAAALDRQLLEAIRATLANTCVRLTLVQPYLMAAFNRVVRPRHDEDLVFMLVEAGRACILVAQGGKWCHVSAAAVPQDPAALSSLLEREIQLADLPGESVPPVVVHAAHLRGLTLAPVHGVAPRMLESRPLAGLAQVGGAACELAAALA